MSEERAAWEQQNPGAGLNAAQFDKLPVVRMPTRNGGAAMYTTYGLTAGGDKGTTGAVVDINHARDEYDYPASRAKYRDVHPDEEHPPEADGQRVLFKAWHTPATVDMLYATANRPEGAPRRHIVQRLLESAVGDHYQRTGQVAVPSQDLSVGSSKLVSDYKQGGVLHPETPAEQKNDVSLGDSEWEVENIHRLRGSLTKPPVEVNERSRQFAHAAYGIAPAPVAGTSRKKGTQLKLL